MWLFAPQMLTMGMSALVLLISGVLTVLLSLVMGEYLSVNAMPVVLGAMLAAICWVRARRMWSIWR